ncbi:hypothetical protein AGMMS50239_12120 [Bacteroidia bacterium]|nr:hypothetical protein AGMMS50239_12120 [Bacteroidia bacterium]
MHLHYWYKNILSDYLPDKQSGKWCSEKVEVVNKRTEQLSKEKKRTPEDRKILYEIELLRRVSHAITQSPDKWNQEMQETMEQVFMENKDLKNAYQVSQDFKQWYAYENTVKSTEKIKNNLQQWYLQAMKIDEYKSVIKMIRKHEPEIINYFKQGLTNAKAENLNGKLQRFVSANYGLKDMDFFLYRTAGYFS